MKCWEKERSITHKLSSQFQYIPHPIRSHMLQNEEPKFDATVKIGMSSGLRFSWLYFPVLSAFHDEFPGINQPIHPLLGSRPVLDATQSVPIDG